MKNLKLYGWIIVAVAFLGSCKKKETSVATVQPAQQASPYYVRMTDAPGPYSAVNVDIQSVVVTSHGSDVTLSTNAGVYNLLNFSNGTDTLLAHANLTTDVVEQIRLVLGPNNSVVSGGVTYSLTIPSGSESGLKLQVHHTLQAGVAYRVLLDFDANRSIVQQGNGSYQLKPVIRSIETAISGSIKGHISPAGTVASITATASNGDTYSTVVNPSGYFVIAGLPAGTYSVTVNPMQPYNATTVNNVTVTVGTVTDVGLISL